MKLIVSDLDYRPSAEEMLITLLPAEGIEYSDSIPDEGNYTDIVLKTGEKTVWAKAEIRVGPSNYSGSARLPLGDTPSQGRQAGSRAVKYSVYRALAAAGEKPAWGSLTGVRPSKIARALLEEGASYKDVDSALRKRYDVGAEKRRLLLQTAKAAIRAAGERRPDEVSLYVGIPFCPTRCAYCSFISTTANSMNMIPAYLDALESEIAHAAVRMRELGLLVNTVYIGGGTPTTLSAAELSRLLARLRGSFDFSRLLEFTVEAGRPDTIDAEKLLVLKDFGVGRISINPQTLDDGLLSRVGRGHTAADVEKAYETARRTGDFTINMDLIAGLPADTCGGFSASLRGIIGMSPENITVHNLAIKRGAALSDKKKILEGVPEVRKMLDGAARSLNAAGYSPYYTYRQKFSAGGLENTGFSKAGADGLYNIFIMEELQSIWSFGAGGVSKFIDGRTGVISRRANPKYPREYIRSIENGEKRAADFFYNKLGRER